jgi:hypothetical protein
VTGNISKEDELRDYLLGRLCEAEQQRLERRLRLEDRLFQMGKILDRSEDEHGSLEAELKGLEGASDEEVEEAERAVRAELFDAYARGEIEAENRPFVADLARESPENRERLAFARALAKESAALPGSVVAPQRRWIWQAAAGIAATVAVVVSLLHLRPPSIHPSPPAPMRGAKALPALEIPVGGTREGEIPAAFLPATSRQEFHLHLPAPAADPYQTFKITILGPQGRPLGAPRILGRDDDQTLHLDEAVESWKPGLYTFQIYYPEQDGKWELLAEPQVELGRRRDPSAVARDPVLPR